MKLRHLLMILFVLALILEEVDAKDKDKDKDKKKKDKKDKKKKKKDKKSKVKVEFDGSDRKHVGCEPHKFTIYEYEDSWCSNKIGIKTLSSFY